MLMEYNNIKYTNLIKIMLNNFYEKLNPKLKKLIFKMINIQLRFLLFINILKIISIKILIFFYFNIFIY